MDTLRAILRGIASFFFVKPPPLWPMHLHLPKLTVSQALHADQVALAGDFRRAISIVEAEIQEKP